MCCSADTPPQCSTRKMSARRVDFLTTDYADCTDSEISRRDGFFNPRNPWSLSSATDWVFGCGFAALRHCAWAVRRRHAGTMAHTIQIEVHASVEDSSLIHRILHFKEDLQREFVRSGIASISDSRAVDRALEPLTISIPSKRSLASVSKCIDRALLRHEVSESIRVQRLK